MLEKKPPILLSTLKIPSPLKSARSSFYNSVLICNRGLWEATAHPLISHHLTVFGVTADSYWAVIALPLSLAQVPAFARPLKCSYTHIPNLCQRGRGVSGLVPAKKKKRKAKFLYYPLQVHLAY